MSLSHTPRHRCVASAAKHGMGSHKSCPYRSSRGPHEGPHHCTVYPCRGNPCGCPSPFAVTNASIAAPQVAHAPSIWWLTGHPAESGLLRQAPRIALALHADWCGSGPPPAARSATRRSIRAGSAPSNERCRTGSANSALVGRLSRADRPPLPSASPPAPRAERGTDLFRGSLAACGGCVLLAEGGFPAEVVLHVGVVAVLAEGQYVVWGREHAAEA